MILSNLFFSNEALIVALTLVLAFSVYLLIGQISKYKKYKRAAIFSPVSKIEINTYFVNLGFIVCKMTPIENTQKWIVFLIKNGEYEIATLFTNSGVITGHKHTIA